MTVFVTSTTSVSRHGVFAIEQQPPAAILAIGTGVACIDAQFPWGRSKQVVEPASLQDLYNEIAPPGMLRTAAGYLSVIAKAWPTIKFVRVEGSASAIADFDLLDTATPVLTVPAKFFGTEGNNISITVADASDANVNHFNLTVSVTGASGTTTDLFQNLSVFSAGDTTLPTATQLSRALLTGTLVKTADGRPDNVTTSLAGGLDGTVTAGEYLGTPSTGDEGLAAMEVDDTIRNVFVDDPGNVIRAAVNAGVLAHAALQGDRVGFINGDNNLSVAATRTDVANYRSDRIVYMDPWAQIRDDVDGTLRDVPPGSFGASVSAQTSPSTSIAWKSAEVGGMLSGIVSLVSPRGAAAGGNTLEGICTIIKEANGGFRLEAGVVAIAPTDPTRRNLTRRQMGDFIAVSFVRSVRGFVDAPNLPVIQQQLVNALTRFLSTLKRNADGTDPAHVVHILDFQILPLDASNSQADLDDGKFFIPVKVKTSSGMEQIFLLIEFGETVTVTAS